MTAPNHATVLNDLRTALLELEATITDPGVNIIPGVIYVQGDFPYWTNLVSVGTPSKVGTGIWRFDLNVVAICHLGWLTQGIEQELEISAQALLLNGLVVFTENPRLKTTSYPNGVIGLRPEGITAQRGQIVLVGPVGKQKLTAQFELSIPISVQLDTTK